jgi:hypothetical protein
MLHKLDRCKNVVKLSKEKICGLQWRKKEQPGGWRKLINGEFLMYRSTSSMITVNFKEMRMT